MQEGLRKLSLLAVKLKLECEELDKNPINESALWYVHMKELYDQEFKDFKGKVEEVNRTAQTVKLPKLFGEADVKSINLESVGRKVTITDRFSVKMKDKEAAIQWLKVEGYEDLITENVHQQSLSSFAKELLEDHGIELPDDFFETGIFSTTSLRKI